MSEEIPFDPFPMLHNPHHQTIISSFCNFFLDPYSEQKIIQLPDGDRISLEISTPVGWQNTDFTVFLVHGLCGSHKSPNLVRMARKLDPLKIRAVRFNMRGCGSGKGLSKQIYHSGRSEDLFEAIKAVHRETPTSPIILVGFSLGANIVLKMVGELERIAKQFLTKVIAVSPPVDLYSSVLMLGDPINSMYEKYFYKLLRADVHYRHTKFKDLPSIKLPKNLKLYEFDQIYTAPYCGFKDVHDYYARCSSGQFTPDIAVPCTILLAEDDPIVSPHSLDKYHLPSNVTVFKTKKGGHMGYLADPRKGKGVHWLDEILLDWIQEEQKRKKK